MPSLKNFSIYESVIKNINFNVTPYSITLGDTIFEIDSENDGYIISSNTEFMINAGKCYFSSVKTNDLLFFNDEFIIFNPEAGYADNHIFLGKVKDDKDKILIFKLPKKISKGPFNDILKIIQKYSDIRKIFIDAGSVLFMDSKAISGMIELIQKDKNKSVYFYKPSYKFKTYLTLANIEKMISVKSSAHPFIDQFIDKRKEMIDKNQMNHSYLITDKVNNYLLAPENVITVGRMKDTCDILLSDESISRLHAVIVNTNNSLSVIDLGSTNSTYINGWKVSSYLLNQLKVNDVITFGRNIYFYIKNANL